MSSVAEIPSGRRKVFQHHHSASPTPHLSSSMKDVLLESPDELLNEKELKLKGKKKGSASNLMSMENPGGVQHKARQDHENEPAEVVIVCEPEGTSLMMGGLHPRASLYERPVNLEEAKQAHTEFRRTMRKAGLRVLTVRDILSFGVEDHMGARVELEELATLALQYEMAKGTKAEDLNEQDRKYLSNEYKLEVLEHMSIPQLIETIMINPTVHISPSYRDTGLSASYTFQPLSNLVYTRDQQITTASGIVMGKLRSSQRQLEVHLMRFCFQKLGLEVIGKIEEPGFLEGGDFTPAGQDLALLGIGLRSNMEAAQQLMDRDLLGTRRLAVVKDDFEQHQDRMHLDCVFSILGDDVCLMLEEMMGEQSPTRRLVDEYTRDSSGSYSLSRENIEFSQYMRDNGYHIIPIKPEHQLLYGCNVLNLGNSKIISVHDTTARQIIRDPHFHGDVQVIDYSPITSMYGAVHCSSQVVRRAPRSQSNYNDSLKRNSHSRGIDPFPGASNPPSGAPSGASSLSRQLANSKLN